MLDLRILSKTLSAVLGRPGGRSQRMRTDGDDLYGVEAWFLSPGDRRAATA